MTVFVIVALVLAFLFIMWLWLIAPQIKNRPDMSELRKFDYAHRGLHNKNKGIPENSLAAFRLAAERGFGIEFDLQITKDRKIVVHHDRSLKRMCGVDVNVDEITYSELQKYRLLGTEEVIPTLDQTLDAVGSRVPLIVEIKSYTEPEEISILVEERLMAYRGSYCVESFDPRVVKWFKENSPRVIRGQLMEHVQKNEEVGAFEAFLGRNLFSNFATRPNFEAYDYHSRNRPSMWLAKKIFAMPEVSWTIRDWRAYRQLKKEGCIIIFEGFEPTKGDMPARSRRLDVVAPVLSQKTVQHTEKTNYTSEK